MKLEIPVKRTKKRKIHETDWRNRKQSKNVSIDLPLGQLICVTGVRKR
jgi:excinuclease UvrABC ATPase subunit